MARLVDQTGIESLWTRYWDSRDRIEVASLHTTLRDELVLRYAPLVSYVVGRLSVKLPTMLDKADLVQWGSMGLIDAVARYVRQPQADFEAYALSRIRGSILDQLRGLDFLPRTARSKAKEIDKTIAHLMQKLGRDPSEAEAAQACGLNEDEYVATCDRLAYAMSSLDALTAGSGDGEVSIIDALTNPNDITPERQAVVTDLETRLAGTISQLPNRSQQVLALYYQDDLTQSEIAAVLKVSESRVSQLHTQALTLLRGRLETQRVALMAD